MNEQGSKEKPQPVQSPRSGTKARTLQRNSKANVRGGKRKARASYSLRKIRNAVIKIITDKYNVQIAAVHETALDEIDAHIIAGDVVSFLRDH